MSATSFLNAVSIAHFYCDVKWPSGRSFAPHPEVVLAQDVLTFTQDLEHIRTRAVVLWSAPRRQKERWRGQKRLVTV